MVNSYSFYSFQTQIKNEYYEDFTMYEMKIEVTDSEIVVDGNIKSFSDSKNLKDAIALFMQNNNKIILNIKNSLIITSEVIGYLIKLYSKDRVNITIKCGNPHLVTLLDNLNLKDIISITEV